MGDVGGEYAEERELVLDRIIEALKQYERSSLKDTCGEEYEIDECFVHGPNGSTNCRRCKGCLGVL